MAVLPPTRCADASAQARARLESQPLWQRARCVLFFAPLPNELDLWPLVEPALAGGKTIALPKFDAATGAYSAAQIRDLEKDIRPGRFGVREPGEHCPAVDLNRLDLLLVPGVAFDPQGWRLGRGKGFYDRLLTRVSGTKCGVAFDEQIITEIPIEPHDVRMDCILTPARWLEV